MENLRFSVLCFWALHFRAKTSDLSGLRARINLDVNFLCGASALGQQKADSSGKDTGLLCLRAYRPVGFLRNLLELHSGSDIIGRKFSWSDSVKMARRAEIAFVKPNGKSEFTSLFERSTGNANEKDSDNFGYVVHRLWAGSWFGLRLVGTSHLGIGRDG